MSGHDKSRHDVWYLVVIILMMTVLLPNLKPDRWKSHDYPILITQTPAAEPASPCPSFSPTNALETMTPVTLYVGNAGSRRFHHPSCSAARQIKPENMISFSSREDAIARNYLPCKRCDP